MIFKYFADLREANSGSIAVLEITGDNKVKGLFMYYSASRGSFSYYCPLLGVDRTHLKVKYKGILLAATATDANGSLFPVPFTVVDAENNDNWYCFLAVVHQIINIYLLFFS